MLDTYGSHAIYALGLPLYAKLSSVISNSQWSWPAVRSTDIAEIISLAAEIVRGQNLDTAIWLASKNAFFSVCSAWNVIISPCPKSDWASLV